MATSTESPEHYQPRKLWKRTITAFPMQDHWHCLSKNLTRGEIEHLRRIGDSWSLLCSRPWNGKSMLETVFCGLFLQKNAPVFVRAPRGLLSPLVRCCMSAANQ